MDESLSQALKTRDAAAAKRAATEKRFQDLELALQQAQEEEAVANDFARRSLDIQQELKAIKARANIPVVCLDDSEHDAFPSVPVAGPSSVLPQTEEDLTVTEDVTGIIAKTVGIFHPFLRL